ncbi:MAG: hypothetical protein HWN67_03835 [Candidatus Helarchaeota archaeon]|nr:hypothetical protein [Candidatus Helarchaeota archaeon]
MIAEVLKGGEIVFYENRDYRNFPEGSGFSDVSKFRSVIDLNGEWEYRKESRSIWKKVFIPSCYEYKGKLIFRKEFKVDSTFIDKHLKLILYGVNYRCTIRINDQLIGNHFGGYSSFSLEIPDNIIIINGKNKIEIDVDSRLDVSKTIPIRQQVYGWKNYGGIFREIFILGVPKVCIDEVDLKYFFSDSLKVYQTNVNFKIRNFNLMLPKGGKRDVQLIENIVEVGYGVELYDPDKNKLLLKVYSPIKLLKIHRLGIANVGFTLKNPELWNFYNPKLYELRVFIAINNRRIDEDRILIGYRDFKIKDGDIYINNEKVKLWGILYQEDYPGLGSALNWNIIEEDIVKIKNLGFNLIQCGYYPSHPYFFKLCDRYGILAIESLPLWNVPAVHFKNKRFKEISINYLKEIIQRDRNHVSIVSWGLGGEFESTNADAVNYVTELVEVLKSKDLRPSFFSSRIIKNEKCADIIDLPGINVYTNSSDEMKEIISMWKMRFPEKPLIISRYGIDLFSTGPDGRMTQSLMNYQAVILESFYNKILSDPDVDISILWSYSDWRLERPLIIAPPESDQYLYPIGLMDYYRNERISCRVIEALNTEGKVPSIFTVNYEDYEPYEYQIIGFIMIISLIYLSRRSKKFSENLKRSLIFPKSYFRDIVQKRVLSVRQTIFLGIMISVIFSVILSSYFYYFRFSKEFDYFISHFIFIDLVKEIIGRLTWKPLYFILYISLLLFIFFLMVSWIVYLWGIFQKFSLPYKSAVHIVFWSGVNNLFLIPLMMVLYPALKYKGVVFLSLFLVLSFIIWYIFRLTRIISISFQVKIKKVALASAGIAIGLFTILFLYYQSFHSTYDFLKFFVNVYIQ